MSTDLGDPKGGFYTALDAEVDGEEGVTYVWTPRQVEQSIDQKHLPAFFSLYQLNPVPGNIAAERDPTGGVLRIESVRLDPFVVPGVVEAIAVLEPARAALRKARSIRAQPRRDEKLLVGLNGLAIAGFATASKVLEQPQLRVFAERAATRVLRKAYNASTGALAHGIFDGHAQGDGDLNDYASFANGLLALYDVTNEKQWQAHAASIADALVDRFRTKDGEFRTVAIDSLVPFFPVDQGDNDYPSGTSATLRLFGNLSATGLQRFQPHFEKFALGLSGQLALGPLQWASATSTLTSAPASWAALANTRESKGATPTAALRSETQVKISTSRVADTVTITLEIAAGFHVNANPASLDFLIPTTVAFKGVKAQIGYPLGVPLRSEFAREEVSVYEGTVQLVAKLGAVQGSKQAPISGMVPIQACNERIYLPPAAVPIIVPN
jgi:uncharacterized protein YyaL (SSP411 family)